MPKTFNNLPPPETVPIPELVARQLISGNLNCPSSDKLAYEACLLYQGALGTWQRLGVPDLCPDVMAEPDAISEDDEPGSPPISAAAGKPLTPADARRAPGAACFGYLYAIQVANATPVLISTANTTFKMASGHSYANPGSNARLCIEARHGICGNHAVVGIALFEQATLKARPVEFYYSSNGERLSHIVVEVLVDGHWRLIDTTYGAYWAHNIPGKPFALASLDELLKRKPNSKTIRLFHNAALLPYGIYSAIARTDFFEYLEKDANILRGNRGSIELGLGSPTGVEKFASLPNYVGDNQSDGSNRGVSYALSAPDGSYVLTLKVAGSAFGSDHPVSLCVDDTCLPFLKTQKTYQFSVTNPSRIKLQSDNDVAYVVFESLDWRQLN